MTLNGEDSFLRKNRKNQSTTYLPQMSVKTECLCKKNSKGDCYKIGNILEN